MEHEDLVSAVERAYSLASAALLVQQYLCRPDKSHLVAMRLIEAFGERRRRQQSADAVRLRSHWQAVREVRAVLSPPPSGGEEFKGASRLPPGVPPAP